MNAVTRRSAGAVALAAVSLDRIRGLGLPYRSDTIDGWRAGERRPNAKARRALEAGLEIPIDAWDRPPDLPKPPDPGLIVGLPTPIAGSSLDAVRDRIIAEANELLADARAARLAVRSDPQLTESERLRCYQRVACTLADAGKLAGFGLRLTRAQLVRVPAFREIESVIIAALVPFPDAARAVASALESLAE